MDITSVLTTPSSWRQSSPPTAHEFFSKVVAMLIIWMCLLTLVGWICSAIAMTCWSNPIPIESVSIPSRLPHPNPPGSAVPFDVQLSKATDEQISTFMDCVCGNKSWGRWLSDVRKLQLIANSAAAYKGLLYQERLMKWIDDHFRLKKSNLKYPYVGAHWNGWSSFYVETGPLVRNMFMSSMTIVFEHTVNGLILPGLYLLTRDDLFYTLALYGEVAYMIYSSTLIIVSYVQKRDVTIEQLHEAVWPLLLTHHVASMTLCTGCIFAVDSVPKDLVCAVLLALLGLTSSLHYVGQILDVSPLAQANAPLTRLCNHVFCLAMQIAFRVIYWMWLIYLSFVHCLGTFGVGAAVTVTSILLLFTLFNIDFVKFHLKATKACWIKIRQDKVMKNA